MSAKGEHGTTVVYADRFIPDDEKKRARETGEEAQAIPFLKRFTVFNLAQREGLPEDLVVATLASGAWADRAQGRGADQSERRRFPHRRSRTFYMPAHDYVQVPPPQASNSKSGLRVVCYSSFWVVRRWGGMVKVVRARMRSDQAGKIARLVRVAR